MSNRAQAMLSPTGDRARPAPDNAASFSTVACQGTLFGWVCVIIGAVAAGVLAARAFGLTPPRCVLRQALGIPCPACGLTHAMLDVLHGNLLVLFTRDPAAALLILVLGTGAALQVLVLDRRESALGLLRSRPLWVAAIALAAVHWAITITTGGLTT